MKDRIEFTVHTEPVACQRPRFSMKLGRAYTDKNTRVYKDIVTTAAIKAMRGHEKLEGPLKAVVIAYMPIPASYPAWKRDLIAKGQMRPTGKPDTDNLAKSCLDSMNGFVYRDDAEIIELLVIKHYAENPRVEVVVESLAKNIYCSNITKKVIDKCGKTAQ